MAQASIKQEAHALVDELSDDATWEDLLREVAMRRAIEEGLEDVEAGRTVSTDELRQRLGVDE
jgi:predicted transcriptional regulator